MDAVTAALNAAAIVAATHLSNYHGLGASIGSIAEQVIKVWHSPLITTSPVVVASDLYMTTTHTKCITQI